LLIYVGWQLLDMATAEWATSSLGSGYASDDPTLPQPWKGLIDGSTGLLYYWNPETNVTQYEKPTALPPPLPPAPPPAASTPILAPIPGARTTQTTDVQSQQSQQMMQSLQQNVQQSNPLLQQQLQTTLQDAQQPSSQIAPSGQQLSSMFGPAMQQQVQMTPQSLRPQMMQYLGQQMPSQLMQVPLHAGTQVPQQTMQPMPQHLDQQNQMYQGGPVGNSQTYSFPHQHTQYMPYQQSLREHTQQIMQGQQYSYQQDQKIGFQPREDAEPQRGKQVGFSPAPIQQNTSSIQNPSAVNNSTQASHWGGQPTQATQFDGFCQPAADSSILI
jgi:ATP-dependent RNA helicase DDX5/DBP2